jgi:hypothetical protein
VSTDDLISQYQSKTGMDAEVIRPFLQEMENAGASIEAWQISEAAGALSWDLTVVTSIGLGLVNVKYFQIPSGYKWAVDATVCDWRSVSGVELTYKWTGGDAAWSLTLVKPKLAITEKDGVRELAAGILRHVS